MKFILASLFGIIVLTGCATTSSVEEVRAIALNADRKASLAIEHAKATDAKIDAMFKKSMIK